MKFTAKGTSANSKAGTKVAQSGTPVPEKDTSSKAKISKAAGSGKSEKGSAAVVASLPQPSANSTPEAGRKAYEGSSEDWRQDYSAAKRKGISTSEYEDSASDRIADAAGERRMKADESKSEGAHSSSHSPGVPAFRNTPKASHGFGHPSSARDGHLRNSGHSGAHRIGKK